MSQPWQQGSSSLEWLSSVGRTPTDSQDVALQKSLLVVSTIMMGSLAVVWGAIYLIQGEPVGAVITWSYSAACAVSMSIFRFTRRYRLFRFSQLLLSLLLPFILMLALGGFVDGSAVILWSLTSPLGALLFASPREAVGWFAGFVGLVAASIVLQPFVATGNSLSETTKLVFLILNVLGVSVVVIVLTLHFVNEKARLVELLNIEKQHSDRLLLNVLPSDIAAILKNGEQTIARRHDAVSVLFADIVGFTRLSALISPTELTELLNRIFSKFDEMVAASGLEKIRTIGDAYMVASGVPQERPDHAHAAADLALRMVEFIEGFEYRGHRIALRIGIASGPVTAGVIGHLKFCYDVWGDTVNMASRMTSQGQANRIHLASETGRLLADSYACVSRGEIEIKGKGPMETWFLQGPLAQRQPDVSPLA